jgi:hypothetical protein
MDLKDASTISQSEYADWNYDEEEEKKRKEQALLDAQQIPPSQIDSVPEGAQGPTITPGDVARTSEKEQLDDGIVTKIGEAIGYTLKSDGLTADALNAAASGLNQLSGGNLQGVDDFFMGSGEQQAAQEEMYADNAERRAAGEMSGPEQVLDTTLNAVTGVAEGTEAGLALPLTLGARVANQNAPWSDPPEILKNSPVGESVMKITEILVPTLLTGGLLGGSTATLGGGAVVAESALETIPQRSSDDLIAGNAVASSFGDIANQLGFDGNQLTQDMVEGKKPNAQVLNAAVGFIQNLGINIGVNQVLKYFAKPDTAVDGVKQLEGSSTPNRPALPSERFDRSRALNRKGQPRLPGQKGLPGSDIEEVVVEIIDTPTVQAARALGKDPEEVAKAVNDVQMPPYSPDTEPSDVFDVDNFTSTARPSKGNTYGSEEAMMREIMRESDELKRSGTVVGKDGFTQANRSFFMNWKAITQDESLQTALEELTKNFKLLDKAGNEAMNLMVRAKKFWQANKGLLDDGPEGFAKAMYDYGSVAPMDARKGMSDFDGLDWKRAMREEMGVTEEGFTVMALAGEQLGVQISKMGRMLNQLEFGGMDFTKSMEVYVSYAEKADLLLVPLRRAKRKWSLEGFAQQNKFQKQVSKLSKSNIDTALGDFIDSPNGSLRDLTKIGFDDVDPGMTLREMWEKYKAGDEEAGKLLKAYVDFMGNIPPSGTLQQMRMMNQIIDRYMKNGSKEAVRALWYATMLATTEPIKAAATGGVLQVLSQPLGNMTRGAVGMIKNSIPGIFSKTGDIEAKRALLYGVGQWTGLTSNLNASLQVLNRSFKNDELIHTTQRIEGLTSKARKQKSLEVDFAHKNIMDRLIRENAPEWQKVRAGINYNLQLAGLNPKLQLPNRILTALDQSAITAVGNSEAVAQGFIKAFDDDKMDALGAYIDASTRSIFEDGIKTGRVQRGDVLEAAKQITMQADIPMGPDANLADNAFKQIELAGKNSGVIGFWNPFVRVNYGFLDKVAQMEPTGFLTNVVPRYRSIIAGEMGEAKEMQLKSGIAFTRLMLASFGGIALAGGGIGKNAPAGMEEYKDSFIIPNPLSKSGFTAVPFGRLQPFSSYLSALFDVTNGFKRNVINTTQYDKLVSELLVSMGMNSLDNSFQQGFQKMAQLLDMSNIETAVPNFLAELTALPISGLRQPIGVFQPYETMQGDKLDGEANFLSRISQRALGGLGNPIKYNRYTGEAILKNGNQGGSYWEGVGNNFINMFGYPGEIKDAGAGTAVFKEMESVGFDTNQFNNNNLVGSGDLKVQLTNRELSPLDQLTGDPKVGALQRRLNELFASTPYKKLKKEYNSLRKGIDAKDNLTGKDKVSTTRAVLTTIHNVIRTVHNQAREEALKQMMMSGDYPDLIERQKATQVGNLINFSKR